MRAARIAITALALGVQVSTAQQPGPQPPGRGPGGMTGMGGMAEHMRAMDSLNARLDSLVIRMNRVTGNQKVKAMADVINELVAQRKAMHEHMREMMQSRRARMHRMGAPAPAEGRRSGPLGKDSAAADTSQEAHHPPN
jgi:hypothetical protein